MLEVVHQEQPVHGFISADELRARAGDLRSKGCRGRIADRKLSRSPKRRTTRRLLKGNGKVTEIRRQKLHRCEQKRCRLLRHSCLLKISVESLLPVIVLQFFIRHSSAFDSPMPGYIAATSAGSTLFAQIGDLPLRCSVDVGRHTTLEAFLRPYAPQGRQNDVLGGAGAFSSL